MSKMTEKVVNGEPDWMSKLPGYLCDCPLYMLAIPGSHNSYSFYTDKDLKADRQHDPIYRQLVDGLGELAVNISYRWTVTQATSLTRQLDIGVRYFDLRVTSRSGEKEDKHVYFRDGPNILFALKEIRRWMDLHQKEVIILDFRVIHMMSAAQHKYLLANMTQDIFENKMLTFTGHVKGITLRNMWTVGCQIIVFYPQEHIFGYDVIWPNNYIGQAFCNEPSTQAMIQTLETCYQHGVPSDLFYVWSGVLTPNNEYLANNLEKTLKDTLSKPASKAIINWIRNKHDINIVVADFVELYDFCTEVIRVNFGMRDLKKYEFENESCHCNLM